MPTKEDAIRAYILDAFGQVSGIFMSQGDKKSGDIVMPTEELIKIADEVTAKILTWG